MLIIIPTFRKTVNTGAVLGNLQANGMMEKNYGCWGYKNSSKRKGFFWSGLVLTFVGFILFLISLFSLGEQSSIIGLMFFGLIDFIVGLCFLVVKGATYAVSYADGKLFIVPFKDVMDFEHASVIKKSDVVTITTSGLKGKNFTIVLNGGAKFEILASLDTSSNVKPMIDAFNFNGFESKTETYGKTEVSNSDKKAFILLQGKVDQKDLKDRVEYIIDGIMKKLNMGEVVASKYLDNMNKTAIEVDLIDFSEKSIESFIKVCKRIKSFGINNIVEVVVEDKKYEID